MTSEPNPKNANVQKLLCAVFFLAWALVIAAIIWFGDSKSAFDGNTPAKDSFYNLLVQAYRAGQLNLNKPVPPELAKLPDPYDPTVNAQYIKGLVDLSYYKGKLYVYFGVTPVLTLFWPYAAVTGLYLSDRAAVIIFFIVGFLVAGSLLRGIWRRYFATVGLWTAALGMFALSVALALTAWCNTNEVARSCAFAFTMVTLAALWYGMHQPKREAQWLLLASLAYGLVIGARPSLSFGAIILLMPAIRSWRKQADSTSRMPPGLLFTAAVVPMMLIGFGLALYNDLRFGNPFEFGWHYQLLDYRAPTARQFSPNYLWFNVRYYFLGPVRWINHFPFLQGLPISPMPSGFYARVPDPDGGILVNYPVALLVLTLPWVWKGRLNEEAWSLRWFIGALLLLFVICATTLCLFFAAGKPYEMDFLPPLLLLAVIGILGLERILAYFPSWRLIGRGSVCLILAYSVIFNLLENIQSHATAHCLNANSLLSEGRFNEAIVENQNALALWPECADAYCSLGSALLQKGYKDEAVVQYRKALEIKPDYAEAHLNLGACFLQMGNPNDAIVEYQKAITINPDSAVFHNALGNAFDQNGNIGPAIAQYQKAIEISPGFAEAYYNLASCFFQAGRMGEAVVQYRNAIELQPESADFQNGLGNALFQKGKMDEAAGQYQKALKINPDFAEAHYNLGYCFFREGRVDDAIIQYQTTIKLQPNLVQAYTSLGDAFHRKGMEAEAKAAYRKAIELTQKSSSTRPQ